MTFLGLSLPDHGYHAPNERFDWGQAAGGIKTFVKYFDEISRIPRSALGISSGHEGAEKEHHRTIESWLKRRSS